MREQQFAIREEGYFSILQGPEMGWREWPPVARWSRLDNPFEKKTIFHPSSQAPGPGPGLGPGVQNLKKRLEKIFKMRVLAPLGLVTLVVPGARIAVIKSAASAASPEGFPSRDQVGR